MLESDSLAANQLPTVSIVMPCRREAAHIQKVLQSILAGDYPADLLEILIVDGMSDDGTREIVTRFAQQHPQVALVDNPRRVIPAALNAGIRKATGRIIVRMDAHTTYAPDYVRQCVRGLIRTGADNVGGPCETVPGEPTLMGRTFATVLSHPFGVGNAHYKLGITQPLEVDAVPFGCMWRERMLEVGPYDEEIARSEDISFTARLRRMGGKVMLLPEIHSYYHARSRLGPFSRHSLSNGYWITYPLAFGVVVGSWRHYIPLVFLLSLLGPLLLAVWWPPALWLAIVSAGAYAAVAVAAGLGAARKARSVAMAFALPPAFLLLHLLYGIGTLAGLIGAGIRRLTGPPHTPATPQRAS